MVKWTDDESSDLSPASSEISPRARLIAWFRGWSASDALPRIVRCSIAGGLALALLAVVTLRAGGPDQVAVAAVVVQAPTFAKLRQSVAADPPPSPDVLDLAAALTEEPPTPDLASRWLRPAAEFAQGFADPPDRMKRLCQDFAAAGFAHARWQASKVFDGEWECSSALQADGRDGDAAFLVVRGSGERNAGSLMLKLNPVSAADRAALIGRVEPVVGQFLAAAHVAPSATMLDRLAAGEPVNLPTSFGTLRIVAEHNRPDVRVISLSVSPVLDAPKESACAKDCLARFRPPNSVLSAATHVAARQ
ncbi:DUF6030 family protein [Aureimonas leprariae]|uniref:Uncharacterized protein n=1 Tax=Plantimonas leprariae TaxID=2615207 RepID=A0A7V7TW93_9HYPH|nr:DUF6030 family protein [Aureimonas leprariae]KAB0679575.1 hypothetical protein F6X38_12175 [Aureimonas leprariae]